MPLLSIIIFCPLAGAFCIACLPKEKNNLIRGTAVFFSLIPFVLSLFVLLRLDARAGSMQFMERLAWIPSFGVQYLLGVDGMSILMLVLTTFLCLIAALSSFRIEYRLKEYFFFFLALETGICGVFCSLDFFLFYVFWNVSLVVLYFLIGIWGGKESEHAALKFFLYNLSGSVALLLCMLGFYFLSAPHTFDLLVLTQNPVVASGGKAILLFVSLLIGFGVIMPIFPLHTWFPFAHEEAPTPISIILACLVLKLGLYGLLRIAYPLLPSMAPLFTKIIAVIGLCNIIYGALLAMAQSSFKKIIAYSSITHMGFCMLGIASISVAGFNGAVLHMFNHGIFTAALLILTCALYTRTKIYNINEISGLRVQVPVLTGFMTLAVLASVGIPAFSGFISEFLCFLGIFPKWSIAALIGVIGILLTAGYFLRMLEKLFLGNLKEKWKEMPDLSSRELVTLVPLIIMILFCGLYPKPVLFVLNQSMVSLLRLIQ